MSLRHPLWFVLVIAVAALIGWGLFVGLPRWYAPPATAVVSREAAPVAAADPARKIKARLFFVSEDGLRLTPVERDVPYADEPNEQARAIIEAQLAPPGDGLVSAIPDGTELHALFITSQGDAFVDLSAQAAAAHPGGSLNELLTVYTIVHALTYNLPAVARVQLLIDGREVDTLAGHVDLRRPLTKNLEWLEDAGPAATPPAIQEPVTQTQERGPSDAIR